MLYKGFSRQAVINPPKLSIQWANCYIKYSHKAASLLLLLLLSTISLAQQAPTDPAERAAREHEERLKQEELRQESERQRNNPESDIFLQPPSEKTEWTEGVGSTCFTIRIINVAGVQLFSESLINTITNPYLGKCLGLGGFNDIVKKISNLYLAKGYVTSRAYVQPQNIEDGILDILVVEGTLEKLESAEGTLSVRQLHWAFPSEDAELLNLRDLEQGLENLNRLQQNKTTMDLTPGTQQGNTTVVVNNNKSKRLSGGAGVNNSGSEATGEHLGSVFFSWDNPTFSNDNVYVSLSSAVDAPRDAESNSYSLAYTVPFGYSSFKVNISQFDYQQKVNGAVVNFVTRGSSASQSLGYDYMLYRGQVDKLALVSSFTRKESKNYLEDVFLDTSSRVLYLAKLGVKYTRYTDSGMLRVSGDWTRSGNWFNAKTKVVAAENDFQFDSISINGSYSKNLSLFSSPFSYQSRLSLFYTPDDVIASEAMSLGGQYTVRGIDGLSLVGYSGGYLRNELSHSFALSTFGSVKISAGIDVGNTDTPEFLDQSREWMAGAVLGLSVSGKWLSLDMSYAEALKNPDYLLVEKHAFYASLQTFF